MIIHTTSYMIGIQSETLTLLPYNFPKFENFWLETQTKCNVRKNVL